MTRPDIVERCTIRRLRAVPVRKPYIRVSYGREVPARRACRGSCAHHRPPVLRSHRFDTDVFRVGCLGYPLQGAHRLETSPRAPILFGGYYM
ncbi:hypothetical protein PLICRDRAFT_560836 [Plicaturopsis crispa FD-325 SS-3]|nr:hypothetical protein PLICRDRAFT_560836 [Plicaturopsis crispa FD-325 SS-3]